MKSFLIIGAGRFGRHLARQMTELNNEVMLVDRNEEMLRDLVPVVESAQIADCTDRGALQSLGVADFDCCFVCIGEDFESSLIATALLKDLGAKRVVSKAGSKLHREFLLRNGADEVISVEKEMAQKVALRYNISNSFDFMDFSADYAVFEMPPLAAWVGKTASELDVRHKYGVILLASRSGGEVSPLPEANYIFTAAEMLIMLGKKEDMERLLQLSLKHK